MTENAIATTEPTAPAPKPQIEKGGALAAMVPKTLDEAFRLASALARAGDMVPKHFQGNPEATMAAIIRGMEVGLAPMQSLAHIAVINGRASVWGDALPALVQRAGHSLDVSYEGEGEKYAAVATLERGDTGKKIVRRFSLQDAKRAGLLDKNGPWKQYPQRMLAMRARSWAVRDGAADALMGLQVAEEVQDYGPETARDVTPKAPPKGGVMYSAPLPSPEPDAEPEVDDYVEAEPVEQEAERDVFGLPSAEEKAAAMEAAKAAAMEQSE